MLENSYCSPVTWPDKFNKGFSHCEDRDDRTCPVQEPDMSDWAYWNLATDPDKSGQLRKSEWIGHVRVEGRTCPVLFTGT
jgi:hypothetical protein